MLQEILLSVVMFQFFTKSSEEPRIVFGCMSNIGPDNALSSLILTLLTLSAHFPAYFQSFLQVVNSHPERGSV